MSVLEAIVLGAVQGFTEFIPISSSGHLVIVPALFNWNTPGLAFDVMLHVASLLALLVYFSGDLLDLWRGFIAGDAGCRRLVALLAVGTVPAALAGFFLGDFFEETFEGAGAAKESALQLLITAVILVVAEQLLRRNERGTARTGSRLRTMDDLRPPDAAIIGIAQAVAIFPGISRSGSTIAAGLGVGMAREDSARFAFLLAIPALFGAALVKVPDLANSSLGFGAGAAGFAASLVTSYAAIWGLIRYLKNRNLYPFAAYCVVAGTVFYFLV